MKSLEIGNGVILGIDSSGITNGSVDVLNLQYEINSDIDKIINYVENNNFGELENNVNNLKEVNNGLLQNVNNLKEMNNGLLQKINELSNKIDSITNPTQSTPIPSGGNGCERIEGWIEPKPVKSDEEVRKEELRKYRTWVLSKRQKPKQPHGWFEYNRDWMVQYLFGYEYMFLRKKDINDRMNINGEEKLFGGPLYKSCEFHRLYDNI